MVAEPPPTARLTSALGFTKVHLESRVVPLNVSEKTPAEFVEVETAPPDGAVTAFANGAATVATMIIATRRRRKCLRMRRSSQLGDCDGQGAIGMAHLRERRTTTAL
jgi:hypothetical protein